jgi:glutathione S-transferase
LPGVLRLVTIPISHYCEKARWALERAGLAYREEPHVQRIHRLAARRAGGGATVPVLVTPDGVSLIAERRPASVVGPAMTARPTA